MLLELNVKDIALIKKASVSFDRGLNILTGETGTGKSVIIDSALLALGGKARGDLIRRGAEYAYIELLFSPEEDTAAALKNLGIIPDDSGLIVISRKLLPGRSISRINDETVTLQRLREVTALLIDIYGQNEYHTLYDRRKHLEILDAYLAEELREEKTAVQKAWQAYTAAKKECERFTLDEKERLRETDRISYEIREIGEARLQKDEEASLAARYKKLNNAKNILDDVGAAYRLLSEMDTSRAVSDLEHALRYDGELQSIYQEMLDAQAVLEAVRTDLGSYADDLEVDEEELSGIEQRLDLIRSLEAKYGREILDVLEYKEAQEARLSELEHYEEDRQNALGQVRICESHLREHCKALSRLRKEGAGKLCASILLELKDLGFEKAQLTMDFQEKAPAGDGWDDAGFMAALNPGEALKPLSEVASGGELSRVMLAVKTVLARTDAIPTLIFDEIDTGISGRTAQKVAEKLDAIGGEHQVICVSHLPQIAAMADAHYVIQKTEDALEGRNVTEIARLDEEGEIRELARLLGGAELTRAACENAREMKALAKKSKTQRRSR